MLYKRKEEVVTSVRIKNEDCHVHLDFYADIGKFHTDEAVASFRLTPERLLEILSDRKDISDEKL